MQNKGGAGGGIGMAHAAKAPPDGYAVLMALSSFTVIPEADKVRGRAPMYALNSLRPIARITADPTVLAVGAWGNARLETMPDVPSLKAAGYDAEYEQWSGLFVAAGTPEAIVQRLRKAAQFAAKDPKVNETIMNAGSPVLYRDTPEFEKYVAADAKNMAEVVKKIGKVE